MKNVEEILNSLDGMQPATPPPYLHTRVMAAIRENTGVQNTWSKILYFLTRPGVALAAVLLIVVLNVFAVYINMNSNKVNAVTASQTVNKEDFVINVMSIYDTETLEP